MTPKSTIIKTKKTWVRTGFCSSYEEKCRSNESHESIIKNAFIFFSIIINNVEMLKTYCRLIMTPPKWVGQQGVFIGGKNFCSTVG